MSMQAACIRRCGGALPGLDADMARGDVSAATGWLRANLQRHGSLMTPRETVAQACGFAPSEGPFLDYLEAKFGEIYRL